MARSSVLVKFCALRLTAQGSKVVYVCRLLHIGRIRMDIDNVLMMGHC
jgi:hypothetical protein